MDRRRNSRVSARLPVRIWGVDAHDLPFMQLASVKNLSSTGAVVQGMRRQIKPGEILEVQSDEEKARFRVIWTGMQGTHSAGEIGLQQVGLRTLPLGRGSGLLQRVSGRRVMEDGRDARLPVQIQHAILNAVPEGPLTVARHFSGGLCTRRCACRRHA